MKYVYDINIKRLIYNTIIYGAHFNVMWTVVKIINEMAISYKHVSLSSVVLGGKGRNGSVKIIVSYRFYFLFFQYWFTLR